MKKRLKKLLYGTKDEKVGIEGEKDNTKTFLWML